MKLYFENAYGDSRLIAECSNESEIYVNIHNFIKECNKNKPKTNQFTSYYTRTWTENGKTWYDVGSHSEYFWVDKELHTNDYESRG